MGDCDVDGPGEHCNRDGKAEARIAESCGGTSDINFQLILGLENDWAAPRLSCVRLTQGLAKLMQLRAASTLSLEQGELGADFSHLGNDGDAFD